MAVSQGFNPRPKVMFTLALALGIEGRREVVELELAEPMEPAEVLRPPRRPVAAGPRMARGRGRRPRPRRPGRRRSATVLDVPADRRDAAPRRLADLLAADRWPYTRHRPDRTVEIDLRPFVLGADLDAAGTLRFRLKMTPSGSARPEEVVDALGLRDLLGRGAVLARTDVELGPRNGAESTHRPDRSDPTADSTEAGPRPPSRRPEVPHP